MRIEKGEGPHKVWMESQRIADQGLWVGIFGGDLPHIGGVAVGNPSPGLNGPGVTCDLSQICLPGHKDVVLAAKVADRIVRATGKPASVTAGVHKDEATQADIEKIIANTMACLEEWLKKDALD